MKQSDRTARGRSVQERSRDTRERILDAAVTALVEDGYAGATTLRIQSLANVSRGRLLHHYPSRDALLVAAVAHLTEGRIAALAIEVEWSDDPRERIDQVVDTMWATFQQPFFWASTELWLAARANPVLREVLLPHERRVGAAVSRKVRMFFGSPLAAHPRFGAVRDLLLTSMRGTALAYAFRPADSTADPHLAEWKAMARDLLTRE